MWYIYTLWGVFSVLLAIVVPGMHLSVYEIYEEYDDEEKDLSS